MSRAVHMTLAAVLLVFSIILIGRGSTTQSLVIGVVLAVLIALILNEDRRKRAARRSE